MEKALPRLEALISTERDIATGDSVFLYRGEDGRSYRLQVSPSTLIPLAMAVIYEADRDSPEGQAPTSLALSAIGFSTGFAPDGTPMIRFRLGNGPRLSFLLSPERVSDLRAQLVQLETAIQQGGTA